MTLEERRVILLLAKIKLDDGELAELRLLMQTHMDWSRIYGMLHTHRLLSIAYVTIDRHFSHEDIKNFAYPRLFSSLKNTYKIQYLKNTEHLKHTINVCNQLKARGVRYVLLKGITLAIQHYEDIGIREFSDTDIMVHTSQLQEAVNAIKELGYLQGGFDEQKKDVVPASRKEIITSPLTSHEVVPLRKRVKHDFMSVHEVDVQFSMDLMSSNRTDELVEEILNNAVVLNVEDNDIATLNPYDDLLYICIHYFKEATGEFDVKLYKDLGLYKICDLFQIVSKGEIDWNIFIRLVLERGLQKAVYFAFFYLNEIFGETVPSEMMKQISPGNLDYLNVVYEYNSKNVSIHWDTDVVDRVFDMNRAKEYFNLQ
ncbi:hypothetical protein D3C75_270480 [compost metagenome]